MTLLDAFVLLLYLLLILTIGWRAGRKTGEPDGFFLAGRHMGWLPIGLSIMVTTFSAINYVALPGEVFGHGLYVIVSLPVFFLAAWPITTVWMPFFHKMRLTSVYEFFERRYDLRVRLLASGAFIAWRLFWMATALYASGNILAALTGLPALPMILVGGVIATLYTVLGGMRAVIWTDVAQFCVLFGGLVLGLVLATDSAGVAVLMATAREGGRLRPFVPFDPAFLSPDPTLRMTLWSGLLGVNVAFLARYGADQVVVQRYFAARDLRQAQRSLWLNAWASLGVLSLLAFFGLVLYADAAAQGVFDAGISLSPARANALVLQRMAGLFRSFPSGVTGLVTAGLLAATMSSIDSGINACSAACVTDFLQRLKRPRGLPVACHPARARLLTLAFGLLASGLALLLIPLTAGGNSLFMIVNKMINGLGSPLLALFVCGMFLRRTNAPGMFYGGLLGLAASLAISLGVKGLSLQYYAVANLLAALAFCLLASELARWWRFRRGGGSRQDQTADSL